MSEIEITARQELEEIADVLRQADEAEKAAKSLKDEVRSPFFDLISEVVREELVLSRETVIVEADDEFDPREWQKVNYPLHRVVGFGPGPSANTVAITIEENEDYKKFEFTHGGFKFGRTVRMDGRGFEADKFLRDLDLYELDGDILEAMRAVVKEEVVTTYSVNESAMQDLMAEHPETVAIFQEFINPGTPKVALLPIKVAKEHEE